MNLVEFFSHMASLAAAHKYLGAQLFKCVLQPLWFSYK